MMQQFTLHTSCVWGWLFPHIIVNNEQHFFHIILFHLIEIYMQLFEFISLILIRYTIFFFKFLNFWRFLHVNYPFLSSADFSTEASGFFSYCFAKVLYILRIVSLCYHLSCKCFFHLSVTFPLLWGAIVQKVQIRTPELDSLDS